MDKRPNKGCATSVDCQFLEDGLQYNCPLSKVKYTDGVCCGDVRPVLWTDGHFYKAQITKLLIDGTANVVYLSDKIKQRVTIDKIEDNSKILPGDIRKVKWKDGRWYPARIKKIKFSSTTIFASSRTALASTNTKPTSLPFRDTELLDDDLALKSSNGVLTDRKDVASTQPETSSLPFRDTELLDDDLALKSSNGVLTERKDVASTQPETSSLPFTDTELLDDDLALKSSNGVLTGRKDLASTQPETSSLPFRDTELPGDDLALKSSNGVLTERRVSFLPHPELQRADNSEASLSPFEEDHDDSDKDPSYQQAEESSDEPDEELSGGEGRKSPDIEAISEIFILPESNENGTVTIKDGMTTDSSNYVSVDMNITNCRGKKRTRVKDNCFYCDELVSQFARHITRHHFLELDVQKIMSLSKKSKERRDLISALRKKGNFVNSTTGNIKPVRKSTLPESPRKRLPCTYCLGFYVRKQLWRHRKTCSLKPDNASRNSSQREAQNLLMKSVNVDKALKEIVFPHMTPDEISNIAKSDALICLFGARYLKIHKEKHQINLVSRKMRELSRLLLEMKRKDPKITNLLNGLKSENFDLVVEAAKVAAKYNQIEGKFHSPTYAMNISTSIKECCEIAITQIYKLKHLLGGKDIQEAIKDFETMVFFIKKNWRYELSHHAANDLCNKTMNKVTIVPLASDIKLFKDYLVQEGNRVQEMLLENNKNALAYKTLVEVAYCRVLTLCRKRGGELARMHLKSYTDAEDRKTYEEFNDLLKPTERILLNSYKRVVIKGKRRTTPVLFSPDVQNIIEIMIKFRGNFISQDNPYLFATNKSDKPIVGYKVLSKHCNRAKLKNPEAITSRRLRKHLATISQIFSMNDQDIEQLSTFMGHTAGVHRMEYRLPDDVFQTAKVTKLLLMMESGETSQYAGKALNEIDINLNDDLLIQDTMDSSDEEPLENGPLTNEGILLDIGLQRKPAYKQMQLIKKAKRTLIPWTVNQKEIVMNFFKEHIVKKKPPKRYECEKLISEHGDILKNKNWLKIKVFVQNCYNKYK